MYIWHLKYINLLEKIEYSALICYCIIEVLFPTLYNFNQTSDSVLKGCFRFFLQLYICVQNFGISTFCVINIQSNTVRFMNLNSVIENRKYIHLITFHFHEIWKYLTLANILKVRLHRSKKRSQQYHSSMVHRITL